MNQDFAEISEKLKEPFRPEQHQDRPLPGGKRWLYVTWQDIRERLDEVYPQWQCTWTEPTYIGDYCYISCTLTIAGVSRQAPGNAQIEMLSSSGKDMGRGTPIERAVADAFKNAAEAFGVARYLDDQKLTAQIMSKKGDYRAAKFAKENEDIDAGLPTRTQVIAQREKEENEQAKHSQNMKKITEGQVKRLYAIAKPLPKQVIENIIKNIAGVESSKDISWSKYDAVIKAIESEVALRTAPQPAPIPPPQTDRDILRKEIASLLRRKNISIDQGKAIILDLFGVDSSDNLTDNQLLQLRDYISLQSGVSAPVQEPHY